MKRITGVMLTVADIKKMTAFFMDLLSFEKVGGAQLTGLAYDALYDMPGVNAEFVILKLHDEYLYLISFDPPGKPYPAINSNDRIFQHIAMVVTDLEKAYETLTHFGVEVISEKPITIPDWNQAAAGIKAVYFRSPEGHPLELIYFPEGKGHPRWQHQANLLLGMDHTAIVVGDTNESLKFYRDQLGLKVRGESLNYGDTQESLSSVKDAKVQITGLGFDKSEGMGLEFLHYLNPVNGAAAPELKSNDLACTYTIIEADEIESLASMQIAYGEFMPFNIDESHPAMIAVDADGHRLLLFNKEHSHAF